MRRCWGCTLFKQLASSVFRAFRMEFIPRDNMISFWKTEEKEPSKKTCFASLCCHPAPVTAVATKTTWVAWAAWTYRNVSERRESNFMEGKGAMYSSFTRWASHSAENIGKIVLGLVLTHIPHIDIMKMQLWNILAGTKKAVVLETFASMMPVAVKASTSVFQPLPVFSHAKRVQSEPRRPRHDYPNARPGLNGLDQQNAKWTLHILLIYLWYYW